MTWGSCQTSIYKRFQLLNSMPKSVITQISKHMCSFCAILNLVPVAEDFLTTWHLYWVTFPYFGPFLFAFISIYWIIFHTWCNNFLWQPLRCGRARPSPETQKVQHRHYHYHSRNNQKSFFSHKYHSIIHFNQFIINPGTAENFAKEGDWK